MARKDNDARSKRDSSIDPLERSRERQDVPSAEVRSIVERQFSLMEQAHDRIRAAELAAHLRQPTSRLGADPAL